MPQRPDRDKRRPQVKNTAAPASNQYAKYLPEWMRENGGVAPKPRVRRAPRQRPVGGYTPGKLANIDPLS